MKLNSPSNLPRCFLTMFLLFYSLPIQSQEKIKIESTSKSSSSHRVILSNVTLDRWVVCWGMDNNGIPLAKGEALVKGTFVEVMVRSTEHHEKISKFFCEYEE